MEKRQKGYEQKLKALPREEKLLSGGEGLNTNNKTRTPKNGGSQLTL